MEAAPFTVIVLAGGWECRRTPPVISFETRLRLQALGALAEQGATERALLMGGLMAPDSEITEAEGMQEYFGHQFPKMALHTVLETGCYDTWSSAQKAATLLGETTGSGALGLLTSRSHLKRATKIFRTEGLDVEAIDAESVLLESGSLFWQTVTKQYLHSCRYAKWLGKEAVMRGALRIDREGVLSRKLAGQARSKYYA